MCGPWKRSFLDILSACSDCVQFSHVPFFRCGSSARANLVAACSRPNVRQVNVQPSKPGLCCDMDGDCKLVQYFPLHSCPPLPDMQKKHQGKVNSCSEHFQARHTLGLPAIQWEAAEEVRLPSTVSQ